MQQNEQNQALLQQQQQVNLALIQFLTKQNEKSRIRMPSYVCLCFLLLQSF